MDQTLYILTRTSRRPVFFAAMRESLKRLTWPGGIVHIVHTDDPRDTYVEGDIIIRGESLADIPVKRRGGQYNLYNNRLLDVIPGDGWVHFMDDDDEYAAPDVFERLLADADPERVIVGHVKRGGGRLIPQDWGTQKSFQTEIPVMRVEVARSSRWPATKGGDHIYNAPIVEQYGCQWVDDVLIATSREGKGNGLRNDMRGSDVVPHGLPDDTQVYVKPSLYEAFKPFYITLKEAEKMAKDVDALITYEGVTAEYRSVEPGDPVEFDTDVERLTIPLKSKNDLVLDAVALGLGTREQLRKHGRVWLEKLVCNGAQDGYKQFRRVGVVQMRPYIEGEHMDGIVTAGRDPKPGDMIAKDIRKQHRTWLVPKNVFEQFYKEAKV